MTTNALATAAPARVTTAANDTLPIHSPEALKKRYSNAFLSALEKVDYGQLAILTPKGERLEFRGRAEGPIAEMSIADWGVFDDLLARGEIGFAEAYFDKRWDTPDLPALLTFGLINTASLERFFHGKPLYAIWLRIKALLRHNSLEGSKRNIMQHYDLGNEFYALWLDNSMTYSCGLFEGDRTRTLEEAQQAKYTRILSKLAARPGTHILEIGCGWGGFATAAAKQGLRVTGITISEKQAELARARIAAEGLQGAVSIHLTDYREVQGQFDHIVSIGMFEHVGEQYWPGYFRAIRERLRPGGTAMVQSITMDAHLFHTLHDVAGFIETYIFPGGMLPSKPIFRQTAQKEGLECHEMFGFGGDYAITLGNWLSRFEARRDEVLAMGYDERFIRLWRFYLAGCIASFRARRTDVMQAELRHTT